MLGAPPGATASRFSAVSRPAMVRRTSRMVSPAPGHVTLTVRRRSLLTWGIGGGALVLAGAGAWFLSQRGGRARRRRGARPADRRAVFPGTSLRQAARLCGQRSTDADRRAEPGASLSVISRRRGRVARLRGGARQRGPGAGEAGRSCWVASSPRKAIASGQVWLVDGTSGAHLGSGQASSGRRRPHRRAGFTDRAGRRT
jgi:hypothetical protein